MRYCGAYCGQLQQCTSRTSSAGRMFPSNIPNTRTSNQRKTGLFFDYLRSFLKEFLQTKNICFGGWKWDCRACQGWAKGCNVFWDGAENIPRNQPLIWQINRIVNQTLRSKSFCKTQCKSVQFIQMGTLGTFTQRIAYVWVLLRRCSNQGLVVSESRCGVIGVNLRTFGLSTSVNQLFYRRNFSLLRCYFNRSFRPFFFEWGN